MPNVTCKFCGRQTPEGAFCEKCGGALDGSSPPPAPEKAHVPPSTQDAPPPQPLPPIAPADDPPAGSAVVIERAGRQVPREAPRIIQIGGAGPETAPAARHSTVPAAPSPVVGDECPFFAAERDTLCFWVTGKPGFLRVRLAARAEGLSDLKLQLVVNDAAAHSSRVEVWKHPNLGASRTFPLVVPPLAAGAYPAKVAFSFMHEGVCWSFEANPELFVYDDGVKASTVAEQIVFNITNTINQGHAGDVRLSQNAADLVGQFARNGNGHGLNDLLDLLKTNVSAYARIPVYLVDKIAAAPSLPPPPPAARADRLTLRIGGQLLHLLAGTEVTFGKDRKANRVCTRLFDHGGQAQERQNGYISRRHLTVRLEGADCVLQDGGASRPSMHGVFWQGARINGERRIAASALPDRAELRLAGAAGEHTVGMRTRALPFSRMECRKCSGRPEALCAGGDVPCLLLSREDVPERYLVLWACADLGALFPEGRGVTLCHERGAFSWRSASGAGWLEPGKHLAPGVRVEAFQQHGIKRPEES